MAESKRDRRRTTQAHGTRRRLSSVRDWDDPNSFRSRDDPSDDAPPAVIPVPKYVPMNAHIPGTIALAFFTHRGFCR
jgi:hypothetical protein